MGDTERAKASASALAALRDPPEAVIKAGALRLFERTHDGTLEMVRAEWKCLDEQERGARKLDWLASWRAALDAKE